MADVKSLSTLPPLPLLSALTPVSSVALTPVSRSTDPSLGLTPVPSLGLTPVHSLGLTPVAASFLGLTPVSCPNLGSASTSSLTALSTKLNAGKTSTPFIASEPNQEDLPLGPSVSPSLYKGLADQLETGQVKFQASGALKPAAKPKAKPGQTLPLDEEDTLEVLNAVRATRIFKINPSANYQLLTVRKAAQTKSQPKFSLKSVGTLLPTKVTQSVGVRLPAISNQVTVNGQQGDVVPRLLSTGKITRPIAPVIITAENIGDFGLPS